MLDIWKDLGPGTVRVKKFINKQFLIIQFSTEVNAVTKFVNVDNEDEHYFFKFINYQLFTYSLNRKKLTPYKTNNKFDQPLKILNAFIK
jgi:hypothetical protein